MEIRNLMVGDWVICNDLKRQVAAIGETVGFLDCNNQVYWAYEGFDRIDPVPLTEEILVKNGFEKSEKIGEIGVHVYRNTVYKMGDFSLGVIYGNTFHFASIKLHYVHQLQHLLRLVGVEKEIEL